MNSFSVTEQCLIYHVIIIPNYVHPLGLNAIPVLSTGPGSLSSFYLIPHLHLVTFVIPRVAGFLNKTLLSNSLPSCLYLLMRLGCVVLESLALQEVSIPWFYSGLVVINAIERRMACN